MLAADCQQGIGIDEATSVGNIAAEEDLLKQGCQHGSVGVARDLHRADSAVEDCVSVKTPDEHFCSAAVLANELMAQQTEQAPSPDRSGTTCSCCTSRNWPCALFSVSFYKNHRLLTPGAMLLIIMVTSKELSTSLCKHLSL